MGLHRRYSDEAQTIEDVSKALSSIQKELQDLKEIHLSAKLTPCRIVFSGQNEPSVSISFINYPKFPLPEKDFLEGVEFIGVRLMQELDQNRIVIEFPDRTIMFEDTDGIDPRISL